VRKVHPTQIVVGGSLLEFRMYRMTWGQMRAASSTAYGESRIFCFNRVRIGVHASNAKRDSI
jgi:hypothetical protein